MTMDSLVEKLDKAAMVMSQKAFRHHIGRLEEAVAAVGNVTDGGGKPLEVEHVLEGLSKIEMDFNDDGTPVVPAIIAHPSMGEKLRAVMEALQSDPVWRVRYEELIEKKREDWRARESSRKLVD